MSGIVIIILIYQSHKPVGLVAEAYCFLRGTEKPIVLS
jgi:hypothetical protein